MRRGVYLVALASAAMRSDLVAMQSEMRRATVRQWMDAKGIGIITPDDSNFPDLWVYRHVRTDRPFLE